jgi:hypothetical protein
MTRGSLTSRATIEDVGKTMKFNANTDRPIQPPNRSGTRFRIVAAAAFGGLGVAALLLTGTPILGRADAGPPAPSALTMQQSDIADRTSEALDSGRQRAELVNELREIRREIADLRALLTSGRVRTTIGNFNEMPVDKIKLEIDYSKLRDAMRNE